MKRAIAVVSWLTVSLTSLQLAWADVPPEPERAKSNGTVSIIVGVVIMVVVILAIVGWKKRK